MPEAWINFAIVVLVQGFFLAFQVLYLKKSLDMRQLIPQVIGIGLILALFFDLLLGAFIGVNSYVLGFGPVFLAINALFAYGMFAASVLLLERTKKSHFILWIIMLVVVYETANRFFPVWKWEFELPTVAFLSVVFLGYLGGAIMAAAIAQLVFKRQFKILDTQTNTQKAS